MNRWGVPAALFSLKCYVAAMLAMFIAFSIGLERPYWAFLTAYIVSGPLAGAVISKALFRVIGTFVGAAMAVFMVPPLVHSPVMLTLAMATWMGLCLFVSLLDRTPRSYMFVLAGYTAGLIVFPSVEAPSHIFNVAALRTQEITIGILCSALIHGLVFPSSVSSFLLSRVDAIVKDAEAWSADLLSHDPSPELEFERRRLAADVTELHQLSVHLPFETSRPAPRLKAVRSLEDHLSQLLPLGSAVRDRIAALRPAGRLEPVDEQLVADTQAWFGHLDADLPEAEREAAALMARCKAIEPEVGPQSDWHSLLRLSLHARLAQLIDAHWAIRVLTRQLNTLDRKPVSPRIPELLAAVGDRPLHVDAGGALRSAIGAFLTVVIGCTLWFYSGWGDGSTAVMLAGVFLSLFAAFDNALGPIMGFFKGTVIATLLGAVYAFAILPSIDGFPEMMAVLAPPLLVLGALLTVPRYLGIALPALLGLGSPFIVSETFGADLAPGVPAAFNSFVSGQMAQLIGVVFAYVMARLIQTAGIEHAIARTMKAGWTDIAERSNRMRRPDKAGWLSRMTDRLALLTPRLAAAGRPAGEPAYDLMQDLRNGIVIAELRELRLDVPEARRPLLTEVLANMSRHYARLKPHQPRESDPVLLAAIDKALGNFCADAVPENRRRAALALLTLRSNLFPEAAAPVSLPSYSGASA